MMARTIKTVLACAAIMASVTIAAAGEPNRHHRRSSAYGDRPAYWGVERYRRIYTDCCGWRWTRLNPGEASIRQLNPRLRARSDGRLLEEVGTPAPRQPEVVVIWPDGTSAGPVIPPSNFRWFGSRHGHRAHSVGSSASRANGASGFSKRAR